MSERRGRGMRAGALFLLLAESLATAQDDYPADIKPPAGTRYPCALTALPRGLPGIPETDRAFINHSYSRILRATQAKLILLGALELQRSFFSKAEAERERGGSMDDVYRIPEGRLASARLIAAWGRMQARYPGWPSETSQSIYHHLCALDLF